MTEESSVAIVKSQPYSLVRNAMDVDELCKQVEIVQEVMNKVMVDGQHYGVIPGCGNKPSLLKPGAEKLNLTFRLRPVVNKANGDITIDDMGNMHREYTVIVHLMAGTDLEIATGVGSCSTMESKYRYRRGEAELEDTGEPIPSDYTDNKQAYRKRGFRAKKDEESGEWKWMKIKAGTGSGKVENPDLADVYNTCLKMAKKRALIDAVLNGTAASDIFTQDLEDMRNKAADYIDAEVIEEETTPPKKKGTKKKKAPAKPKTKPPTEPTPPEDPPEQEEEKTEPEYLSEEVVQAIAAGFDEFGVSTQILETITGIEKDKWTEEIKVWLRERWDEMDDKKLDLGGLLKLKYEEA